MTPTIIFDFDGTLAVGNGPVLAYARFVANATSSPVGMHQAGLDSPTASTYLADVTAALAEHDAGNGPYRDGYDVVGSLARERGIEESLLSDAYTHSRTLLGTAEAAVDLAPGLSDLFQVLDPSIHLLLATNAPESGIPALLREWGIDERFARLHFTVGKPAGLETILREALAHGPVLSIGDIYEFDLAPAATLGADTALVGAKAASAEAAGSKAPGTEAADTKPGCASTEPTMRARTMAELIPHIEAWAASA